MKLNFRWIALLGLFCLVAMPGFAGDEKTVTLEGGFVWQRGDDEGDAEGALKAVLTPTGEGEWDVTFHFDWEDGEHVYTGSCMGSLGGELSGKVQSDGEREMNFKFNGSFEDGKFSGTHGFVNEEGYKEAGTLTLMTPEG